MTPALVLLAGLAGAAEPATQAPRGTIVLIHGLYLNDHAWEPWVEWLEGRGFAVVAEPWPHHGGDPATLRETPTTELIGVTLDDVVEHYKTVVNAQSQRPWLIGHSMGGLVVQRLLAEGYGRGGVAIDSAPPRGVSSLNSTFLVNNLPLLGSKKKALVLTKDDFDDAFTHTLTPEQAEGIYEAYVVPVSRRVGVGPTTKAGKVDWCARVGPLLLISGGKDRVIPEGINVRTARRYRECENTTGWYSFPERSHWTIGEPGWEDVASYAIAWLETH